MIWIFYDDEFDNDMMNLWWTYDDDFMKNLNDDEFCISMNELKSHQNIRSVELDLQTIGTWPWLTFKLNSPDLRRGI